MLHTRPFTQIAAIAACALLAACGGGGGGAAGPELPTPPSNPSGPGTPTPPTPPTTNPSLPLNPPQVSSTEFQRSYGLAAIHAEAGFNIGATGKGVTVAVLDTGFNPNATDMIGAYSPDSTDIVSSRNVLAGVDGHGALVASVLGARFNGQGTIGVAYEATVLGIRADNTAAGAPCDNICHFNAADLARGIDYAVAHGAKVINISLAAYDTDAAQTALIEAALTRAVAAGAVFTVAASNSGEANPATHALYAADSRYAGAFLAIGATGPDGAMASFSNRAGITAQSYLTAPGVNIPANCGASGNCESASGTSFAAPHVAGGIAMLLQYFPNLSGRDAVSILIRTADDRGETGTDAVWGRGAMNLTRAFEPVGASTLALPGGAQIDLPGPELGSMLGAAFGDAVTSSGALTTVISDDYNRLFAVNLAESYRSPRRLSSVAYAAQPVNETAQALDLPLGGALTLAASMPMFPYAEDDASPVRSFLRPEAPTSASASVRMGQFNFTAWRGQGEVASPQGLGGRNAFLSLASANSTVAGVWQAGGFAFSGEGGWAERRTVMSLTPVEASRYAAATAAYAGQGYRLSFSAGALQEPRGALGSEFNPASALSLAARTRFASVGLDRMVGPLALRAEASVGRTQGGGRLIDIDNAVSSSWRLALSGACDAGLFCQRFGVELAQPLRVERGLFRAMLADAPTNYDDPITFSERTLSAAPSSRELDLRFNIDRPLGAGALRLEAAAAFNPAHQQSQADLGLSAMWRTAF